MDVLRLVEYDLKQIIQSHGLRKVMLVFKIRFGDSSWHCADGASVAIATVTEAPLYTCNII